MEKRISVRELAAIKRIAMNVNPMVVKKNKAKAMVEKWTKEYNDLDTTIKSYESGIIAQLGVRTEQVVSKVIENTGKFDKNGKEIKATKYVINDNVHYDQDKGEYVVIIPETDTCGDKCTCECCSQVEEPVAASEQETVEEPVASEQVLEEEFHF